MKRASAFALALAAQAWALAAQGLALAAQALALAAQAFALSGCGHTETHVAMLRAAERPTGREVELYMADQAPPARPYYDIALVQAIGSGGDSDPEDLAGALRERAASLGCDAVIRVFIDVGYSRGNATGVCVKFLAPGPRGPKPVLPPPRDTTPPPSKIVPAPAPRVERLPSDPYTGR